MTSNNTEPPLSCRLWPINTFSTEEEPGIIREMIASRLGLGNEKNNFGAEYWDRMGTKELKEAPTG